MREDATNPHAAGFGQTSPTAIVFFVLFVIVSLGITYWAARRTHSIEDFLAAGRRISAVQNGFALAGDFVAAAGFLGIVGLVSLTGFDGLIYAVGSIMGWPVMMFLLAEPLRNLGKYTFADVLSYRLQYPSVRICAAIVTLVVVFMALILQIVGAGSVVQLLFGFSYEISVVVVGTIMVAYVLFGGMIAVTWVQIIKCALMTGTMILLGLLTLAAFGHNPIAVFRAAAARNGLAVLSPGGGVGSPIEALSIGLSLVFGVASLPQVLMRFYTVPDAPTARRSLLYATLLVGTHLLIVFILGFGAMALIGSGQIRAVERGGNMALPLLAERLGGMPLLGFVAAVAFATTLAAVAGIVISATATLSHDLWTSIVRKGRASPREQLLVAKIASVIIGAIGMALGILFKGQNIAYLSGLTSAVAASAIFPALVLAVFWRRFTKAGAITGMLGGLLSALLLMYLSPLVQVDILQHAEAMITLRNPAIISFPFAFLLSIVVSLATYRKTDAAWYAEVEHRMLVGWKRV